MLEKLFARLRLWRQADSPAGPMLATSSLGAGGLPTLSGPMTPPPLPADAWAESESGIVITDSGISILGPDAEPRAGARPAGPPARAALPTLPAEPPPSTAAPKRSLTPGELDWDDVLARARARAQESLETAPPPPASARARPKAQALRSQKPAKPAKNGK
jgi:hypothetical protein